MIFLAPTQHRQLSHSRSVGRPARRASNCADEASTRRRNPSSASAASSLSRPTAARIVTNGSNSINAPGLMAIPCHRWTRVEGSLLPFLSGRRRLESSPRICNSLVGIFRIRHDEHSRAAASPGIGPHPFVTYEFVQHDHFIH